MRHLHSHTNLKELVKSLPEIYQPIYGHPEFINNPSRQCTDRLIEIEKIYDLLCAHYSRPLKILDLGCSQGFFSFSLAEKGAVVYGIDNNPQNISLCLALKDELEHLDVRIEQKNIEEVLSSLKENSYDMVIGLSVFHHLIHQHGLEYVQDLIHKTCNASGLLIVEAALKDEGIYWSSSLPSSPIDWFDKVDFSRKISSHSTHLSKVSRPMFFASNRFVATSKNIYEFSTFRDSSHDESTNTFQYSRKYFFGDGFVAKQYLYRHSMIETNKQDYLNECNFLTKSNVPSFRMAKIIENEELDDDAITIMELIKGDSLIELIKKNQIMDPQFLLLDILNQLACLESCGYYHDDLRSWNIIISESNEAYLIDYASVSKIKSNCNWPDNIYFSFLIFAYELLYSKPIPPVPFRQLSISPLSFTGEFRKVVECLWEIPVSKWSFEKINELMLNANKLVSIDNLSASDIVLHETQSLMRMQFSYFLSEIKAALMATTKTTTDLSKLKETVEADVSEYKDAFNCEITSLKTNISEFSNVLANIFTRQENKQMELEAQIKALEAQINKTPLLLLVRLLRKLKSKIFSCRIL